MQLMMEILAPWADLPLSSRRHTFTTAGGVIGRSETCDWCIPDPKQQVSGQHASVSFQNGQFYLTDTSRNGTWNPSNGQRLLKHRPQALAHNAVFRLSHLDVAIRLVDAPDLIALEAGRPAPANSVIADDFLEADPMALFDAPRARPADDDLSDVLAVGGLAEQPRGHAGVEAYNLRPPTLTPPGAAEAPGAAPPAAAFWRDLGTALGMDFTQLPTHECEQLAIKAAHLLQLSHQELQRCLHTCRQLEDEMRFGPPAPCTAPDPAQAGLDPLLAAPLATSMAHVTQGYRELQRYQVAVLAASRAAVLNTLEQLSPAQVAAQLEQGRPRRWRVANERWRLYCDLHQGVRVALDSQPLSSHFSRAYAEQQRLLDAFDHPSTGAC